MLQIEGLIATMRKPGTLLQKSARHPDVSHPDLLAKRLKAEVRAFCDKLCRFQAPSCCTGRSSDDTHT